MNRIGSVRYKNEAVWVGVREVEDEGEEEKEAAEVGVVEEGGGGREKGGNGV